VLHAASGNGATPRPIAWGHALAELKAAPGRGRARRGGRAAGAAHRTRRRRAPRRATMLGLGDGSGTPGAGGRAGRAMAARHMRLGRATMAGAGGRGRGRARAPHREGGGRAAPGRAGAGERHRREPRGARRHGRAPRARQRAPRRYQAEGRRRRGREGEGGPGLTAGGVERAGMGQGRSREVGRREIMRVEFRGGRGRERFWVGGGWRVGPTWQGGGDGSNRARRWRAAGPRGRLRLGRRVGPRRGRGGGGLGRQEAGPKEKVGFLSIFFLLQRLWIYKKMLHKDQAKHSKEKMRGSA
jgi:hypothetical protein